MKTLNIRLNLSKDIDYLYEDGQISVEAINKIKEFIRLLKEEISKFTLHPITIVKVGEVLDRLAGDKLI
jgi:hypothetical protein